MQKSTSSTASTVEAEGDKLWDKGLLCSELAAEFDSLGQEREPMRRKRKSWPWQIAQLNTDEPAIYYLWLRTS
eukprot:6605338-Alexandrium_andersonii.AAC.1